MLSTVTMVPVSPRLAKNAAAPPPATSNAITTRTHFFRNTDVLLCEPVASNCKDRRHERRYTHIDGQQPPGISPGRSSRGRRHPDGQQPHPPHAEHINRAEEACRPRAFVEHPNHAG